jgi:CheY-like chemotaxis protein
VLLVEDEVTVLMLAQSILSDAGHETLTAADYRSAEALLEEGHRPDLAFIDHNLGEGLSGIDAARTARRYHPPVRVLYTSGDPITDGVRAMFVDGGEFLPKPYTREQLLETVDRMLAAKPADEERAGP